MGDYQRINNTTKFKVEKQGGAGWFYVVTYFSNRGDYWVCPLSRKNKRLIESALNSDNPKLKDLKVLRELVMIRGFHYRKNGNKIIPRFIANVEDTHYDLSIYPRKFVIGKLNLINSDFFGAYRRNAEISLRDNELDMDFSCADLMIGEFAKTYDC